MKVSLQLANQFSNVDLLALDRAEIVRRIGAQLGAVEEVIDWGSRYNGIVVARIVSCQKHPNADKLNVCLVDDGGVVANIERNSDGFVQVVCGAPNARAGITVAWLPPGSTVPSTIDKDPFTLEARELRGVVSNGMLASPSELGVSEDHDGILEITAEVAPKSELPIPGTPFKQLLGLDDLIIDCENKMFTHRPDCFGVLGVARELAGIFELTYVSPDWYNLSNVQTSSSAGTLQLQSKNEITDKVPRFMVQIVENVTVKPSHIDVQSYLTRLGSRPINNIVDATNFYMQLTAQPTHAFDYDKVKALCDGEVVSIFPRMAKEGEELELLNGKKVKLTSNDIVIATETQAIALGGVMGGAATEVDASTKNIIIECANFDMYTIRRTSMRHGIFSDAVTRFNKGQSHLQNPVVLAKLVSDICAHAGGTAGLLYDSAPEEDRFTWEPVQVTTSFINSRLGASLRTEKIKTLLENVEFKVETNNDAVIVTPPFWRKDIEIAEDIVEEVGRLYGYDKLAITLPSRSTAPAPKNKLLETKKQIRHELARAGANEVLTYSFVAGKLLEAANQNPAGAYQLSNALSPELQYFRLTLTPSLLSKVYQNIRAGYDQFALFEINKTHLKIQGVNDEGVPPENEMLSLVYAANDKRVAKDAGAAYFYAKTYLDQLASQLGLALDYAPITEEQTYEITKPYDWKRSALVTERTSGNYVGIIGEFKASVRRNLKLPVHSAGFEIMLLPLQEAMRPLAGYTVLSRFPHVVQDITFKAPKATVFDTLAEALNAIVAIEAHKKGYIIGINSGAIYHKDKSPQTSFTFHLDVHHPERTLTTDEVSKCIDRIAKTIEKKLSVKRV